MNILFEYIKYHWKAKRLHGVHSPFVYEFGKMRKVEMDDVSKRMIRLFSYKMRKNKDYINIQDFGAGSKKLSSRRRIDRIFSTASSKNKYGLMLYQICKHYQPKHVLEMGTSLGFGTMHMALGNPKSEITTLEGCPATYQVAVENFSSLNLPSVRALNTKFINFLNEYQGPEFDLVFIDGHHDGESLKAYLQQLKKCTHEQTMFILDDIRWSESMFKAWLEIINKNDYSVSIDLFRMGLVTPRPQQFKEHFFMR